MGRKTILTCGYFSLNSVYKELHAKGYDIVKMRDMVNQQLDSFCIDDSKNLKECLDKEALRYLYESRGQDANDRGVTMTKEEMQLISFFGSGGVRFSENELSSHIISSKLAGSISCSNGYYDYLIEANKKYNIKAILLHSVEGAAWGTIIQVAKELSIPTFCCYNGTIVKYITEYTAHSFFNTADYYYLHGQCDVDWLERRINSHYDPDTMPIVGQPTFDVYYNKNGKVKKPRKKVHNTFLYGGSVVYNTFELPAMGIHVTLDMIDYSFYRDYKPSNLDGLFIRAFGEYQKSVNPDAELVVALRPYYPTSSGEYQKYAEDSGVKNIKVFDHMDRPFRSLIKDTKYVVSGVSTVLIESLLNRKPMLCLTGDSDRVPFDYIREWATISRTSNSDLIVEGLINMTKNEYELIHNCNKYATHFNYDDDGKAGERLAEDLIGRIT
jgi:hypothetical protein